METTGDLHYLGEEERKGKRGGKKKGGVGLVNGMGEAGWHLPF